MGVENGALTLVEDGPVKHQEALPGIDVAVPGGQLSTSRSIASVSASTSGGNEDIRCKEQAKAVYDRFRLAVREGRFSERGEEPSSAAMTFDGLADLYVDRYINPNGLSSADTIGSRLAPLRAEFGPKLLAAIRTADIEDFIALLKTPTLLAPNHKTLRVRKPAQLLQLVAFLSCATCSIGASSGNTSIARPSAAETPR